MSRRLRPAAALAPLVAALSLAGCGAADPATQSASQTPSAPPSRSAPPSDGLRVAPTDLRLGDATSADARGRVRDLPVPQRRIDPDSLERGGEHRDGVTAGAGCADADLVPTAARIDVAAAATLCLLNAQRAEDGAGPLTANARLATAAVRHSRDMVANQFFAHLAADGRSLVDRVLPTGYIDSRRGWSIGENLAWGSGTLSSPRKIMAAWMGSQGHRENLLNPVFREVGIGIVPGNPRTADGSGATYTSVFGLIGEPSGAGSAPSTGAREVAGAPAKRSSRAAKRRAARKRAAAKRRAAQTRRRAAARRR